MDMDGIIRMAMAMDTDLQSATAMDPLAPATNRKIKIHGSHAAVDFVCFCETQHAYPDLRISRICRLSSGLSQSDVQFPNQRALSSADIRRAGAMATRSPACLTSSMAIAYCRLAR
jgi:hypothetical protein